MAKYCPSCGAEVKEGFKFCLNCGATLQPEATASTFEEQVAQPSEQAFSTQTPPVAPVPPPQQPMPQQTYAPMQPKKTNIKLIGGIIGIVVAIVVVILVVFLFLGGGGAEQFIGTWNVETTGLGANIQWTFKDDGTLEQTYDYGYGTPSTTTTTWKVENNKLYIGDTSGMDLPIDTGMSYAFSDGGNKLTLSYSYGGQSIPVYTLTKT